MAFCDGIPKRLLATSIAIAIAVCMMGALAAAQQTLQPRAEVFGGCSWLNPDGFVDWGKVPSIVDGWNGSGTFYLPNMRNLGFVVDGSGHYNSTRANVGLGTAGLQYKFRNDQFSPFVHVLVGAAHISPAGIPSQWRATVGAGGGFDLQVSHLLAIRVAQADYFYTTYNPQVFTAHNSTWNMVRLSAGCSANPTTPVFAGEPVTVTATGTNFNPKHPTTYAWTTTGGKLATPSAATSQIDTTGLAPGNYTANATIT